MSKRVKVLVPVVVAVLVVVLLTVSGVAAVMAKSGESASPPAPTKKIFMGAINTKGLLARVAEILGIPQEEIVGAFKQAQQEMREEAGMRSLDKAVEKGHLTEDEASDIKEWWAQKPRIKGRPTEEETSDLKAWWAQRPVIKGPGLFPHAFGAPGSGGRHMKDMKGWRGGHMGGWYKGRHSDNTTQNG